MINSALLTDVNNLIQERVDSSTLEDALARIQKFAYKVFADQFTSSSDTTISAVHFPTEYSYDDESNYTFTAWVSMHWKGVSRWVGETDEELFNRVMSITDSSGRRLPVSESAPIHASFKGEDFYEGLQDELNDLSEDIALVLGLRKEIFYNYYDESSNDTSVPEQKVVTIHMNPDIKRILELRNPANYTLTFKENVVESFEQLTAYSRSYIMQENITTEDADLNDLFFASKIEAFEFEANKTRMRSAEYEYFLYLTDLEARKEINFKDYKYLYKLDSLLELEKTLGSLEGIPGIKYAHVCTEGGEDNDFFDDVFDYLEYVVESNATENKNTSDLVTLVVGVYSRVPSHLGRTSESIKQELKTKFKHLIEDSLNLFLVAEDDLEESSEVFAEQALTAYRKAAVDFAQSSDYYLLNHVLLIETTLEEMQIYCIV